MLPVTALVKPIFTVPFERDVNFIDRKDIFAQIEGQLDMHHRTSICGLGGVGYTFFFTAFYKSWLIQVSENLKLPSSTLIVSSNLDRRAISSGCTQPTTVPSCRPVMVFHGAWNCLRVMTQRLIRVIWSPNGSMRKTIAGSWFWTMPTMRSYFSLQLNHIHRLLLLYKPRELYATIFQVSCMLGNHYLLQQEIDLLVRILPTESCASRCRHSYLKKRRNYFIRKRKERWVRLISTVWKGSYMS